MAEEARACGLALEGHLYGNTSNLHRVAAHRSYKSFWRVLGKRPRAVPVDGLVHDSVRRRHAALGYGPAPLKEWLAFNGGWTAAKFVR